MPLLTYINNMRAFLEGVFGRFCKVCKDRSVPGSVENSRYQNARMSHNRLQSLEGQGYRQCYMEKLRAVSDANDAENKERWFGEPAAEAPIGAEAEAEKRRMKLAQAQHRMSHTRLEALVQTLTPEQLILNEQEARRLGGPGLNISMPPEESGSEESSSKAR